jgi:hypothetical protein
MTHGEQRHHTGIVVDTHVHTMGYLPAYASPRRRVTQLRRAFRCAYSARITVIRGCAAAR